MVKSIIFYFLIFSNGHFTRVGNFNTNSACLASSVEILKIVRSEEKWNPAYIQLPSVDMCYKDTGVANFQ